jgi:16S rRNA (guanine527-N7)-methyltransferase
MKDLAERLRLGAAELGVTLTPEVIERMLLLLRLLDRWGRVYNLTAIRDPEGMLSHHLLDSLAIHPYLFGDGMLDLGTGAGMPGLPLAMLLSDRDFWLLDSNAKRIRFVRQAAIELGIENVHAVHERIQAYRPARKFSTIAARAVASIAEIHDWAAPLLASPGRLLLMKGRYPADELAQAGRIGLDIAVHRLHVPYLHAERHLVEIRRD